MKVPGRVQPVPATEHLWEKLRELSRQRQALSPDDYDAQVELRAQIGKLSQEIRKITVGSEEKDK